MHESELKLYTPPSRTALVTLQHFRDIPEALLAKGKLDVSVKDRQGNTTRIERTFRVGIPEAKK